MPSVTVEKKKMCEGELMEKEIHESLISMENNKSLGNYGLTKGVYCFFRNEIKSIFMNSVRESKYKMFKGS